MKIKTKHKTDLKIQPVIKTNRTIGFLAVLNLFLFLFIATSYAQETPPTPQEVGIDEKLGETMSMDMVFYDEYGKGVTLGEMVDGKPTVISIVYYRCPGLCSPLLTGLVDVVDKVDLEPGEEFNVITISMDHTEDYHLASEKKKNYLASITRPMDFNDWRFLTADSINSRRITDAIGWNYKQEGKDFLHGAALTMVSPEGKIVRYLFGTDYNVFDFKMAVLEASEGRIGATIAKVMQICYSYDPEGRSYTLNVTRVSGSIVIFLLGIFAVVFLVKRKKKSEEINKEEQNG
ncbi:MAG TPA: SCO family protein [Ignavibacteria bacterium]|nr:SCO family protein [Ignavibacteria bacterium]